MKEIKIPTIAKAFNSHADRVCSPYRFARIQEVNGYPWAETTTESGDKAAVTYEMNLINTDIGSKTARMDMGILQEPARAVFLGGAISALTSPPFMAVLQVTVELGESMNGFCTEREIAEQLFDITIGAIHWCNSTVSAETIREMVNKLNKLALLILVHVQAENYMINQTIQMSMSGHVLASRTVSLPARSFINRHGFFSDTARDANFVKNVRWLEAISDMYLRTGKPPDFSNKRN